MLANMADSDGLPGDDESDDAQAESCMALRKPQLLGFENGGPPFRPRMYCKYRLEPSDPECIINKA